jgi:hypothetical protein
MGFKESCQTRNRPCQSSPDSDGETNVIKPDIDSGQDLFRNGAAGWHFAALLAG